MSVYVKLICISIIQRFYGANVCMLNIYWHDTVLVSSLYYSSLMMATVRGRNM